MKEIQEILDYLTPYIITAGDYSHAIQGRIHKHAEKPGATPFHHALSDADLSIQSFLEVALLARFPELSFFSEEQAQSLNAKYFPQDNELEVLLDPVDGTRPYIAGRKEYQVIVTIHNRAEIVAAACYLPRYKLYYSAIKHSGAYLRTKSDCLNGLKGEQLKLYDERTSTDGAQVEPILVFNRPDLIERLKGNFLTLDLLDEFNRGDGGFCSTDLLKKRAAGLVIAPAQAIDGGALAFISQEAGAIVTNEEGVALGSFRKTIDRTLPWVIVSRNERVHRDILKLLPKA
jgi:fructose-1,6-bisphosphatase/inositol monophosphatase family enzyme